MKRFLRLISIFLIPVLFISCRNLFGNDDYDSEAGYVIQGTITQSEVSDAVYRTAFPSQPLGTVYYRITAKCGEETVEEKSISASTDFSLKIPHVGDWTVFAEGFTDNGFNTLILKSEEKLLRISDESPMGYANLVLKPSASESGTGNVSLRIILPVAGTSPRPISSVTIGGIDPSVGITASVTGNQADITGSDVKSGSYTVEISFMGTVSGVPNVLLYHVTEVINVYDNLITDTWVKHGDEPYFDNNGNFLITDAMTQEFLLTTVYVGGEGAKDSNNGTFLNPVATFTKAITINGAKNFFITGEVSAESGCSFTPAENGFIKKHPNADTAEILLTESNDDTLITIGSGRTFEISNITIAGPGSTIRTKSGIVNNGNLTLNNCFIKGFACSSTSTHNGGAIYNSAGTLTINGGKILGCGAAKGGAIYMAGGSLTIKGTTIIEDNKDKNEKLNNIELANGQTISINGTGTGSNIGITKAFAAPGDSTVQFASDTTTDINTKYFSDAGYTIGNSSGKGCIARTTGAIAAGIYEDVIFVADETEFFVGEGASTITFSAKVGAGTDPVAIDNWSATVTYAGMDITGQVTKTPAADKKSYEIVLPENFPEGNYYIVVRGNYNGGSYSGTTLVKIEANIRRFTGANIASVDMSKYAGKTLEFVLDSTVTAAQLGELSQKIHDSTATIDLDLSQVTDVADFSSTYFKKNMRKIKLPDNLSVFDADNQKTYGSDIESVEISDSNSNFKTVDGVLFNKNGMKLIYYPTNNPRKTYTLPNTVDRICESSFISTSNLETLICPNAVTIETSSFYNAKISHMIFQSITPVTLEKCAFREAYGLIDMTFYSTTPPALSADSSGRAEFSITANFKFTKIYVPAGCKSIYVNTPSWNSSSTNYLVTKKTIDQWIEELAP